ncbi:MAG: glycosyltransferase [Pseudomonadota bacterium]
MSLRVLMTADPWGGVWVHALALCRALAAWDVRVRLLALGEPSADQRRDAAAAGNVELIARRARLEWMAAPWRDLDALENELLEHADAAGADVVHLNHLVHGHLAWRRPVVCAVHSCVTSWFEAVRGAPPPPAWDEYRARVARSLRSADHVVAPTRWMLERAGWSNLSIRKDIPGWMQEAREMINEAERRAEENEQLGEQFEDGLPDHLVAQIIEGQIPKGETTWDLYNDMTANIWHSPDTNDQSKIQKMKQVHRGLGLGTDEVSFV